MWEHMSVIVQSVGSLDERNPPRQLKIGSRGQLGGSSKDIGQTISGTAAVDAKRLCGIGAGQLGPEAETLMQAELLSQNRCCGPGAADDDTNPG